MSETTPQDPHEPGAPGGPDGPQTQTAVLERTETVPEVAEPGDHERFAHYVRKEKIVESAVTGEPVTAADHSAALNRSAIGVFPPNRLERSS